MTTNVSIKPYSLSWVTFTAAASSPIEHVVKRLGPAIMTGADDPTIQLL
jgi:hypothetical protein